MIILSPLIGDFGDSEVSVLFDWHFFWNPASAFPIVDFKLLFCFLFLLQEIRLIIVVIWGILLFDAALWMDFVGMDKFGLRFVF